MIVTMFLTNKVVSKSEKYHIETVVPDSQTCFIWWCRLCTAQLKAAALAISEHTGWMSGLGLAELPPHLMGLECLTGRPRTSI
jgi:hypothetical protein